MAYQSYEIVRLSINQNRSMQREAKEKVINDLDLTSF